MEVDDQLRAELAICEEYRISHSHYLGGPSTWTPEDRAKVVAYRAWQAGLCGSCRTREEWFDPKRGGHRAAMIAETHRCPGCQLEAEERKNIPSEALGVHVRLVPNPGLTVDDRGRWLEVPIEEEIRG
jgi:hypothetical protein